MIRSKSTQGLGARMMVLLTLMLFAVGCTDNDATPEQLLASAKQERDKGQYRAAIVHLKGALQKSPQNAEARYLLGVTFNEVGDFKSAEIELRKAIDLRYDLAKVKIGKSLLMMGQFQKVLDEVIPDPNVGAAVQAEILTLRAQALFGLDRSREGRELLDQALAKQPEFADALLTQARLAVSEGKLDETSQFIERALASAPKNVEAWLMKGGLAQLRVDPAGESAAYQKALEISPENISAHVNITKLQIDAGKIDDARKEIAQIRKIAPNHPVTKYLLALIEFHEKRYTAAHDAVLQALKAAPDDLPSTLLAGAVEFFLGEHAQAQAHLKQVLERAPTALYARKVLIASLAKTGQIQRAVETLEPGLREAPEDGTLMGLAGEVYLQNNEFAKAVEFFEKAAKLDPKSASMRTGLGRSRLATGETDRALADLEAAVELDSDQYQADILLVMSHLRRANFDQALRAMQSLEKKQPNNPLTYNLKGMIFTAKKDAVTARKAFERALELQPTYLPAMTNLALMDLQDKNPQAARRRLEAVLSKGKDENNVQVLLLLANLAPRIDATSQELIAWLERARKVSPDLVQPQLMLARAYALSGDPKRALEIAQQAQRAHPDNPEALDMLGNIEIGVGAKEQALATYNKLVALRPKSADAFFRLAMAHTANADPTRAETALRKALALRPDFLDAQTALVAFAMNAGRYSEALGIAHQVQKQSPKSAAGLILEGDILMAQKKFPQATTAYDAAYGMEKSSTVLIKLHAAYTQAGKRDEADRRLAQWLKESPDDANVRLYAADAARMSGNYKSAIEHYEWLLKKEPDNYLLLNNLAWTYQQVKDARALETAQRAYKLKPDLAALADTLGWILAEQGDTKRGIDLLQKAATAAPKNPAYRYHLAQALVKSGDRTKARQELEKLPTDSPGSPFEKEVKQLREDLRR